MQGNCQKKSYKKKLPAFSDTIGKKPKYPEVCFRWTWGHRVPVGGSGQVAYGRGAVLPRAPQPGPMCPSAAGGKWEPGWCARDALKKGRDQVSPPCNTNKATMK